MNARAGELADNLDAVRERLHKACAAAGRAVESVQLLPVTKNFPATDVACLLDLGCSAFGEAREQEASAKVAELAQLRPTAQPHWHVLGRLQRNKARSVVRWAYRVESVDSDRLLLALDTAVGAALRDGVRTARLDILIQVSVDDDPARGGCPSQALPALLDCAAQAQHLRIGGLMAVAPRGGDADEAFAAAQRLSAEVRDRFPDADQLSLGMSGDLEAAVRHGSTCVRVGTALLGARPITST